MATLQDALRAGHVVLDMEAEDFAACLQALTERLAAAQGLADGTAGDLRTALQSREELGGTCIGRGVAVPHAYVEGVAEPMLLFARLGTPLDYGAPDGEPVDLVFLLCGPPAAQRDHLALLARVVRLLHDTDLIAALRGAASAEQVYTAVQEAEARHG